MFHKGKQNLERVHLESQLLEEPLVFAGLVALLELGPDGETGLLLLHGIFQDLLVQVGFVEGNVDRVASWHQVVVIDDLKTIFTCKKGIIQ
jgi:hypothetical protein